MSIKVEIYRVVTASGRVHTFFAHPLKDVLTLQEIKNLDEIGYSGKFNGLETTRTEYLNSLGKGTFEIKQIAHNGGDFSECFIIARAYNI